MTGWVRPPNKARSRRSVAAGRCRGRLRLRRLEVADLPDAAYRLFAFQSINGGLNRRVGGAAFGKSFLDFADGGVAPRPQGIHDLQFQLGELGLWHGAPTTSVCYATIVMCFVKGFCGGGFGRDGR